MVLKHSIFEQTPILNKYIQVLGLWTLDLKNWVYLTCKREKLENISNIFNM